jgi:hypothetical protein
LGNTLTIQITADPAQAAAALAQLEEQAGASFEIIGDSAGQSNEGILSACESARLLTEELGIHMPRAVTSAVSEMLPSIAGLGSAMRGAEQKLANLKLVADLQMERHWTQAWNQEAQKLSGILAGQLVPALSSVQAQLAPEVSNLARLRDAFFGLTESTRDYSREQIQAMLQAGDITVAQADRMVEALNKQAQAEVQATLSAGLSMLQFIAGRRAVAAVEAVWETAKAYAAFADFDFWAGAQHLLAAVQYALVAVGVGAGGSSAVPRIGTTGAAPGVPPGSGTAARALAPGAASVGAPQGQLTVMIMGPNDAAQWLANNVLNPYTGKGGTLIASHSKRQAYAAR